MGHADFSFSGRSVTATLPIATAISSDIATTIITTTAHADCAVSLEVESVGMPLKEERDSDMLPHWST